MRKLFLLLIFISSCVSVKKYNNLKQEMNDVKETLKLKELHIKNLQNYLKKLENGL